MKQKRSFLIAIFTVISFIAVFGQESLLDKMKISNKQLLDARNKLETSNVCEIKDIQKYAGEAIDLAGPLMESGDENERKIATMIVADASNNMGYGLQQMGNTQEALNYYYKAIDLYEGLGMTEQLSDTYNNLAAIYLDQGDSAKCLKIYNMILDTFLIRNDSRILYQVYNNLGYYYSQAKQYRKSLAYYFHSLEYSKKIKDKDAPFLIYNNIGSAYAYLKLYDSALYYVMPSHEYFTAKNDEESLAWTYNLLGRIYLDKSELDQSEKHFIKSAELSRKLQLNRQLMQVLDNLVFLSRNKGKFKEAFEYLQEKQKIEKAIVNSENLKKLYQKEAQLLIEKKEAIAAEQAKQEKVKQQFLIACLVLALLISVIAIRSFVLKRRSNQKLQEQNSVIVLQKNEVEYQKKLLEEKQKEILDSIKYSKRIQSAYLPPEEKFHRNFRDAFLLFKPKDIVSGDFYWFWVTPKLNTDAFQFFCAVADCTGHGVPGALMSVICCNALNEVVVKNKIVETDKILNETRKILKQNLKSTEYSGQKDGMDIALVKLDFETGDLWYSGAYNPLWVIQNDTLIELTADKQPIGVFDNEKDFTVQHKKLNKGDVIYLFSDGFADQFGGEKGKKFKYKAFGELLLSNSRLEMQAQKQILNDAFEKWKGSLEQVDDVTVIGIRL